MEMDSLSQALSVEKPEPRRRGRLQCDSRFMRSRSKVNQPELIEIASTQVRAHTRRRPSPERVVDQIHVTCAE